MNRVQFCAVLLKLEAHTAMCRATVLLNDERSAVEELLTMHKLIGELCVDVLSPDETKLFLAN